MREIISVIVPTYNEEKNIENCLLSLQVQSISRSSFEVIVVDGQSKDKTCEIAARYADRVIQQVSKGVGGARNDGAMMAKGTIIATTDADCILPPEWLEVIKNNFKDPNVVAATGLLRPEIKFLGDLDRAAYKIMFELSNAFIIIAGTLRFYHLCGANSAFRRDIFIKVGGYSDLPYSDDVEIVRRLASLGRIVMDPKILVHYSIRRIKKIGLLKYTLMIFRNDWAVMFFNYKPMKNDYAKQTYE